MKISPAIKRLLAVFSVLLGIATVVLEVVFGVSVVATVGQMLLVGVVVGVVVSILAFFGLG